jgi:serine protease Do
MPSDHAGARSSRAWAVYDVVSVVGVVEYQLNAIKMIEVAGNVPQNVNFAIRTAIVTDFLAVKGVSPSSADRG